jgi:hypothetical protein
MSSLPESPISMKLAVMHAQKSLQDGRAHLQIPSGRLLPTGNFQLKSRSTKVVSFDFDYHRLDEKM